MKMDDIFEFLDSNYRAVLGRLSLTACGKFAGSGMRSGKRKKKRQGTKI